jgi:two-component system response regulator MprA
MVNRKGRVLVVDDDVRTARLLARLLEEDGFDVEVSSDGASAIARLSRSPAPEVLVTDLRMPHADGLSVARYARSLNARMPVFIVTGYPELATDIEKALGFTQVFAKPLAYPELTAAMTGSLTR